MDITFMNVFETANGTACMFEAPTMDGSYMVTDCIVKLKDCYFEMTIVDPSELPKGGKEDKHSAGSTKAFNEDSSQFNPNKISIPF